MKTIDIVINSYLRQTDGGRETWLSQWLPNMLDADSDLRFRIIFMQSSNKELLIFNGFSEDHLNRITLVPLNCQRKGVPLALQFCLQTIRFYRFKNKQKAAMVIGVGGIWESFTICAACSRKMVPLRVVWLRSIFVEEVGARFSPFTIKFFKWCEKKLLKRMDVVLSNGKDIEKYYLDNYQVPVYCIPNAVNIDKWWLNPPQLQVPINIAYIGRLSEVKGIYDFCRSVEKIHQSPYKHKIKFHVVGNGDAKILKQITQMHDKGMIEYYGAIPNQELPKFLLNIDACVALTYHSNGFGGAGTSNALLEQMAANRLMIVWDNLHLKQIINDNSALVVKEKDVNGLVDAYIKIVEQGDQMLALIDNASKDVKRFTFSSCISMFVDYFKDKM